MKKSNLLPHEVLELVDKTKGHQPKMALLQEHSSFALKTLLQINYLSEIEFDLPEGAPPYVSDENPAGYNCTRINNSIRILAQLVKSNKRIGKAKKEIRFTQFLESVHSKDAELIVACKDHALTKLYPSITKSVVRKSFPTLRIDE
jgi:hypothetical protein